MPGVTGSLTVVKSVKLDGAVYASPIAVDGVIVVATENDSVYGLDPQGRQLWHVSLGVPSPQYQRPCGNINPLGITGTPLYSAQTGDVYVAAEHGGTAVGHDLIALGLHTGQVRWRKDIDLPGATPAAMQQRGALAITGGRVWVSFGAEYGDCSDYKGRVVGVNLDGTGVPVEFQPSVNRQGGIWNPAGPTVDAAGHMYVVSANGSTFPGAPYDHTNSVLEVSSSGKLLSSFAPTDWAQNNEGDVGLGSQGVALVGTQWAVLGGKSGPVYVLRQGDLGGIGGQVSVTDVCLSFGGSAVDGNVVYLPCTDGVRAVRVDSAGQLHVLWHASGQIAGSPVVGGGRVWALDQYGGVLHALNPANGQTLEQVSVGVTSRFATPAIYGSLVLVPTIAGVTFVQAS
jgi:outer membrane protein assembly factor BamB